MTTTELKNYSFKTFLDDREVKARPRRISKNARVYGATVETFLFSEFEKFIKAATYPVIEIPAGRTLNGEDIEPVWQVYDEELNIWINATGEFKTRQSRIALRLKTSVANPSN